MCVVDMVVVIAIRLYRLQRISACYRVTCYSRCIRMYSNCPASYILQNNNIFAMILLEISALYKSFTYLLTYKPVLQVYCTSVSAISLGQNLATPLESRRYVVAFTRLRVEAFGYVKRV